MGGEEEKARDRYYQAGQHCATVQVTACSGVALVVEPLGSGWRGRDSRRGVL